MIVVIKKQRKIIENKHGGKKERIINHNMVKGHLLLWYDEYTNMTTDDLINYEIECIPRNHSKVICLNTGEIYESAAKAQDATNIDRHSICKCCKNKREYAGLTADNVPIVWMYYKDYVKMTENDIKNKLNIIFIPKKISVICLTTGEIFDSILSAENKYNAKTISLVCRNINSYSGVLSNGVKLKWMYLSDFKKLSKEEQEKLLKTERK